MTLENNIWHVYPQNDLGEHILETVERMGFLYCQCDCCAEVRQVDGGYIVVHNSYDGREGVEWANEILK
jgi:hypothetical protein